jgi:hypothetical protein
VDDPAQSRPRRLSPQVAAWCCLLAFWAFATLFFGGQIGPWNDDYFFNLRDPEGSGLVGWAVTSREPYLPPTGHLGTWRPLLFTVITWVITLAWDHFHLAHLLGATLHLANVVTLYALLRRLGRSVHAAAAASGLVLCWAATHEAWLWPSAMGSVISALLLQFAMLCMTGLALRPASSPWPRLMTMVGLTVAMLGFNEQATGGLIALPLIFLAVAGTATPAPARLWRSLWPAAVLWTLPPLYVLLVRATAQQGLGVSAESYVPPSELGPRVIAVFRDMERTITMKRFWYPAFALGWREWTRTNALFLPWLVTLAAAAAWALRHWVTTPSHGPSAPPRSHAAAWLVALAGLVAAAGACLPVAVIANYPALSRVTYVVVLMLALPAACLFDGVGRASFISPRTARAWSVGGGLALLALMLFGSVMSVGAQARLKRVVDLDARNARQLVEQVPSPAADTVFLPLRPRPPAFTAREILLLHPWLTVDRIPRELEIQGPDIGGFQWMVRSAWQGLWSMKYFVKFAYGRDDVWSLYAVEGKQPILDADDQAVRFIWPFGVPYAAPDPNRPGETQARIPWDKVVPITFDEAGNLQVVTRVLVRRGGDERTIAVPQLKGRPEITAVIELPPPSP